MAKLTDAEVKMLADLHKAGEDGLNVEEYADNKSVFNAPNIEKPLLRQYGLALFHSLERFELIDVRYDHSGPFKKARHHVYTLNDEGKRLHDINKAMVYKCCPSAVRLFCVCRELTYCPEHGGGCHGSHD